MGEITMETNKQKGELSVEGEEMKRRWKDAIKRGENNK